LKSKHPAFVLLPPELVPASKGTLFNHVHHFTKHYMGIRSPVLIGPCMPYLVDVLKNKMNGKEFENMPSVWWLESGRMLMSVYVDNLTLGGGKNSHPSFWKELDNTSVLTHSQSLVVFLVVITEFSTVSSSLDQVISRANAFHCIKS